MNKQKFCASVLALAAFLLMAACTQEAGQNQPITSTSTSGTSTAPPAAEVKQRNNALVRVIHAIPGGSTIDVFADDTKAFSNLTYKTTTPYQELSGERHIFRVRVPGMDKMEPLAQNSEGLGGGKHYTVIVLPGVDNNRAELRVVDDNLVPPTSGKARVRLINASADAGEVDVYAQGQSDKFFAGVKSQSASNYNDVDPLTTTLEVRPVNETNSMFTTPDMKFDAGKIYTILLVGRAKTAPKLETIIVEDQLGGTTAATQ